jgi:hypothetical protein
MLHQFVELTSIVLRPEPLNKKVERHCKPLGKTHPVQIVAKPPSKPGTAVPGSGVPTADIHSSTPAIHSSKLGC